MKEMKEKSMVKDPLDCGGRDIDIGCVLRMMASQGGCDGEPYDQMMEAAEYIHYLEGRLKSLLEATPKDQCPSCKKEFTEENKPIDGFFISAGGLHNIAENEKRKEWFEYYCPKKKRCCACDHVFDPKDLVKK